MIESVRRGERGLSLAEIVVALGLVTVLVLVLAALSFSALGSGQKSDDLGMAVQVAQQQLRKAAAQAKSDPSFWGMDYLAAPWTTGSVKVGNTHFEFEVFAQTLMDPSTGQPVGGNPVNANRVKKVDIVVSWENDRHQAGRGKQSTRASCLVTES